MTTMMDAERFRQLAAAYGAEPRRWPPAEREAATAFLASDRRAERLLFEARLLDAALDASPTPSPAPALRQRVIAAGPAPRPRRAAGLWSLPPAPWAWASGAAWAAASVAGIVIGMTSAAELTRAMQADIVLEQASASAVDDLEILG